ncbi:Alpha/Beta hydrolase protein [Spinellus fusiger]|nr:Alpha/Beta hydrolase protein [Spinellus fusiger]
MLPDTPLTRGIIISNIFIASSIAPLAFFYTSLVLVKGQLFLPSLLFSVFNAIIPILSNILHIWLVLEVLFWIFFLTTRNRLQAERSNVKTMPKESRQVLFNNCIEAIDDIEQWVTGWYYDATTIENPKFEDIKKDNLYEWLAGSLWNDYLENIITNPEDAAELQYYTEYTEKSFNVKFTEGRNSNIRCIRMTLDKIEAVHRPLFFYVSLYIITFLFDTLFLEAAWGFKRYGADPSMLWGGFLEYPHKAVQGIRTFIKLFSQSGVDQSTPLYKHKNLIYWYRSPQAPANRTPLLFIHGLGGGPVCYTEFIHRLASLDRPIFVVELPHVSMHMVDHAPNIEDTVKEVVGMLKNHGHDRAVVVSHSYGTAIASWLMKNAPEIVAGSVLIDPICFLMHYHNLCFNFLVRIPRKAVEYAMRYCAGRELYTCYFIKRQFQWVDTIFFVHQQSSNTNDGGVPEIQPPSPLENSAVFLSELDIVSNSVLVSKYLTRHGVDAHLMTGLDHAGFMFNWEWRERILRQIERVASSVDDEGVAEFQ